MSDPAIPEEAVQAATEAMAAKLRMLLLEGEQPVWQDHVATALADAGVEAAAPILAEHIARLIRAQRPAGNTRLTWESGIKRAARIAREAYPKEAHPDA